MPRGFLLPAPAAAPVGSVGARARAFLLGSVAGYVLLGALGLVTLEGLGLPLPSALPGLARFVLGVYAVWATFRLTRFAARRLLWRIRTKLIFSYLFIALVPVVLLTLFFLVAGLISGELVASYLVTSELQGTGRGLLTVARGTMPGLPADDRAAAAAFAERLGPARRTHPGLAYTLIRKGRVVSSTPEAPQALPDWWKEEEFAGIAGEAGRADAFRVVSTGGDLAVILDVPVDMALFTDFEQRTGIRIVEKDEIERMRGGRPAEGRKGRGSRPPLLEVEGGEGTRIRIDTKPGSGLNGVALPDRVDWATGQKARTALVFQFNPFEMVHRLSAGMGWESGERRNVAEILVYALGALGLVFLVMYAVALFLGLVLARSITSSIHALSRGTKNLRLGDFSQPIAVTSRDQLGELAESFNHMAMGIQVLLREQAEKERLEEELRIARQIQMSLLPAEGAVTMPGLRIAALCLPAAEVGGDYYDLLPLSPTRLGVLVADVSGKGTSAALYMAELKGLVLSLSRIYESPAKLLSEANRILAANMDSRSFITMTYAVVDVASAKMRYARAGHNPIIQLEAATGRTKVLTPPGLGLGIDRGERFEEILEESEVRLVSGDAFLFFTDGLSEAMNPEAELFGEGRLRTIVEEGEGLGSEELKERILAEIRGFAAGAAQADDMTLVILKVA
jgi:serine phosphatase RsbU (regulator of sigma subunit)